MDLELLLRVTIMPIIPACGYTVFLINTAPNMARFSRMLIAKVFSFLFLASILIPFIDPGTKFIFNLSIFILASLIFLKCNIMQSFLVSFIMLILTIIIETVIVVLLHFVLGVPLEIFQQGFNILLLFAAALMYGILALISLVLRHKIKAFLLKRNYLKSYQITVPLIFTILMLLYVFWVNFYVNVGDTQTVIVQILMVFAIVIIAGVLFYVTDRYMKNRNENLVLKARVSSMTRSQENPLSNKSEFEKSVEFDLFSSDFGQRISENYQLEGLLYESENSLIYKLSGMDSNQYTLKAIGIDKMASIDFKRLQTLNIKQVVALIEYENTSQFHYFLKPYIDGENLHEYVKSKGAMSETPLMEILQQLMSIIRALHEQTEPLIYRDIKPSNLIIDHEGKLHLIDIETIRVPNSKREMDTILIATKGFTAPEQYGFSQSHEKSDIFSIGATAYFLATGKMPHYDDVHNVDLAVKEKLSNQLIAFIRKCMQFNPEDRFTSVKEAAESLSH